MDASELTESQISPPELTALVAFVRSAGIKGAHLEIGTAAGGTLRELMLAYPVKARPPFVAVDTFAYFPNQRATVERNLLQAGIDLKHVTLRAAPSYRAVFEALDASERYEFVLIDARHDAFHVMQDLTWTRMVVPGGYVCFHDYSKDHPGVVWAVDTFVRKHSAYRRVDLIGSLLILRKEFMSPFPEVGRADLAKAYAAFLWHRVQKRASRMMG